MKKLLLTLLTVVCAVSSSWAQDAPAGTTLWADNFGNTQGNGQTTWANVTAMVDDYDYSGRTGYSSNATSVTYTGDGNVKLSKASATNVTETHLWFYKQAQGVFTTSAINLYGAQEVTFSLDRSKGLTIVSYSFNGTTWTELWSESATGAVQGKKADINTNGQTSIYIKIVEGNNSNNLRVDNLSLVVKTASPNAETIDVTGVTLNKNTTSIEVGGMETLTATVAPTNATNKNVTWSSDNEDVATVENGVVTAVAAGTATITVTTTDGSYTDNCVVTVTEPVIPEMAKLCTLVFKETESTSSDSGTKYTNTVTDVFSSGSDYVASVSGNSNCYPARQGRGAKFGTSGNTGSITITLADGQKAIGVILNASGYGNGEVNAIIVNGISKTPTKYASQGFEDLTYIFTEATNTITIATAAKRGYVKSIDVMVEAEVVTVNSCGNASFSCDKALDFTNVDGVAAYMVTAETEENVTLTEIKKVPADTGVFLIGDGGNYNVPIIAGATDDASANKLHATTTAYNVTGSDNIWALSKNDGLLHPVTSGTIAAGKAYLVSAVGGSARALVLDNESTGIQSVQQNAQNGVAYNLAGQRVAADTKGIVIMNGKKYLNK